MKPSDEPAEEKEPAEADEPSAFRLRMRDVRLSEAVVRYEDDSTGMRAGVDPLDLRLSGDLSASAATSTCGWRRIASRMRPAGWRCCATPI